MSESVFFISKAASYQVQISNHCLWELYRVTGTSLVSNSANHFNGCQSERTTSLQCLLQQIKVRASQIIWILLPHFVGSSLWSLSPFFSITILKFWQQGHRLFKSSGLCCSSSLSHAGFLYEAFGNGPRATTQRCRHWQWPSDRIAIANAIAEMRCIKLPTSLYCIATSFCWKPSQ